MNVEFGEGMKDHFLLDKNTVLLNHGSYGAVAKVAFEKQNELRSELEYQPDHWMRKHVYNYYQESIKAACKVVNAKDNNDLVIVDNVTTGIESILNSLNFSKGDGIVIHGNTYGIVQMKVHQMKEKIGIEVVKANLKFPVNTEDDIVEMYENAVTNHNNVKLAIVDHITSPTGVIFPLKKITKALRKHDVMVLVDGAHGPGHVEIDVEEIDADFYVGNFHKWMYAAHSSALLWCKSKYRDIIKPPVVSKHYYDDFSRRFIYLGTRDFTSLLTIPTAVDFHNSLGGIKGITSYTGPLLDWASDYLCKEIKTEALPIPSSMRAPNVLVIKYPGNFIWDHENFINSFVEKYSVQIVFVMLEDRSIWMRIMANVYTTKNDFVRLRDSIIDLLKQNKN